MVRGALGRIVGDAAHGVPCMILKSNILFEDGMMVVTYNRAIRKWIATTFNQYIRG